MLAARKPHIVFILVDDLGWNDVSWHNTGVVMPNLDAMARSGLILEQAYSQPTCSPTRAALLTGYYPSRTGYQFMPPNNMEPIGLPTSFNLLPEYIAKLGYSSHALGKWHLGFCSSEYLPTNRGFESFYGFYNAMGYHKSHITAGDMKNIWGSIGYDFHLNEQLSLGAIGRYTDDLIVDRVNDILFKRNGIEKGWFSGYPDGKIQMENNEEEDPFFLYLAYQSPHMPLQVDPKYLELYPNKTDISRKTYLAMVSSMDDSIGRIVENMKRFTYTKDGSERTLFDDTIFIFSSDNGGMSEGLGYGGASNKPLRGRKGDTWEGGCRVPAFITNLNMTGTHEDMFHMTDWLPTIYSGILGANQADLGDIDGINQLNVLQKTSEPLRYEILYDIANFQDTNFTFYVPPPGTWPASFELSGSFGAALRVNNFKLIVGCSTIIGCSSN